MNCEKYTKLISLYIDGELNGQDLAELKNHLSTCESCQEEMKILQEIIRDLKGLEPVSPPEGFRQELMGRIKVIPLVPKKNKWYFNVKLTSAVAAAFIFTVILVNPLKNNGPNVALDEKPPELQSEMVRSKMADEPGDFPEGRPKDSSVEVPVDPQPDSEAEISPEKVEQPPKEKVKEQPPKEVIDAPVDQEVNPIAKASIDPEVSENREPPAVKMIDDRLPESICTIMSPEYVEDANYIVGAAKDLGIEAEITKRTSEESQNQVITIEMTISSEQMQVLDSKMDGLEKTYVGPDYDPDEGCPEINKLIINVTKY